MTTSGLSLNTRAGAVMWMVTGLGPQLKRMSPPFATAATTLAEVQLAGLPFPITWSGCDVSTARASGGTGTWSPGLADALAGNPQSSENASAATGSSARPGVRIHWTVAALIG